MPERRHLSRWRAGSLAEALSTSGDAELSNSCVESEETEKPSLTRYETSESGVRGNLRETSEKPPVEPHCWVTGCPEEATDQHLIYCAGHRVMADNGTLLLRCVFDNSHAPVAPYDPIACAAHRAEIDRETSLLDQKLARGPEHEQNVERAVSWLASLGYAV